MEPTLPGDGEIDWQFDEAAQQWFNPETGEYAPAETDPNAPPVYAGYEDWGYDPATGAHIDPQVGAMPCARRTCPQCEPGCRLGREPPDELMDRSADCVGATVSVQTGAYVDLSTGYNIDPETG